MHDYLLSADSVRFAFVFGVIVSIMLYEKFHLTTGSIVVPGYIGIFVIAPMVIVATFVNAALTYLLMHRVIRKRFILYGRSKFVVQALISIVIQTAMLKFSPSGSWLWENDFPLLVGAGYVVPALIAHDMGRQGVKNTVRSVMIAGGIVAVPLLAAVILKVGNANELSPLEGFGEMSVQSSWVPFAILLSAGASWALGQHYDMRSGGFVGAAYVGMFMGDPYQVLASFGVAFLSYGIVRGVLVRHLILFGRRKFSAMLMVSSMISWTLLWTGTSLFSARVTSHLDAASLALTPLFVPGLLANDMDRSSPLKVCTGSALAASFVVPTTWWVQATVAGEPVSILWKLASLISTAVLFGPSLQTYLRARAAQQAQADTLSPVMRWWQAIAP
jgi:poly-gamma-glutamate biosynthesis protein PgsC/CapC